MKLDPALLDFCTVRQREILQAVLDNQGIVSAAKKLKVAHSLVSRSVSAAKKKAALQGYSPEHGMIHAVPSPFVAKGISTYYDEEGRVRGQWVKTKLDDQKAAEAIQEWIEGLTQGAKGLSPLVPPPKHSNADLLMVYPIGDPHIGMYSWAAETGSDFDAKIAERQIQGAIDRLVEAAPPAETCLVIELGDLIHADNSKNVTPQNENSLDVDTRWARVMQIGLRTLIYAVKRALSKHKRVVVKVNKGNHDPHSSFAIALALDAYFSNNQRVTIDLSPAEHWYYKFGKVLIGSTHGDKSKFSEMPGIMACDKPKEWGETTHRYWYQGHIHHKELKEFGGCTVEAFRTLAAPDAWHRGMGYRAGRDMCAIVHHREHGEIGRQIVDIGMLRYT